jgi:glyoxylate/hydroxypyruvate reductase
MMPQVARRPTVFQLVTETAANIRSIEAGGLLLQEVDITSGTNPLKIRLCTLLVHHLA